MEQTYQGIQKGKELDYEMTCRKADDQGEAFLFGTTLITKNLRVTITTDYKQGEQCMEFANKAGRRLIWIMSALTC